MSSVLHNSTEMPLAEPQTFPLSGPKVGMICVMCCETVMFASFVIAYLIFLGQSRVGPYPEESLSLAIAVLNSVFLISSSFTIKLANRALHQVRRDSEGSSDSTDLASGQSGFRFWMMVTAGLALLFMVGTGYEWWKLIVEDGLTIGRNLFGTTYFTLIGCHGLHVIVGAVVMLIFVFLSRRNGLANHSEGPEILEWYWHLVDAVWIVILLVVYVYGA